MGVQSVKSRIQPNEEGPGRACTQGLQATEEGGETGVKGRLIGLCDFEIMAIITDF